MKIALFPSLLLTGLLPMFLAQGEENENETEALSPAPPHWEASYWDPGSTESFWKSTSRIKDANSTVDSAAAQPLSPSEKRTAHHSPKFLDRQTEK